MICVYFTSTDTGGEDISNTNNKTFSHIVSVGFLRLISMMKHPETFGTGNSEGV